MTLREAAQQALDALEMLAKWEHPASNITTKEGGRIYPHRIAVEAADALRASLAHAGSFKPLTNDQIHDCFYHVEYETPHNWLLNPEPWCVEFTRSIEKFHGIGEKE